MFSASRIVIVDPARDIVPIVRGALALLNRQHILVEVPTAGDVLDEARRGALGLVVTAYRLPGGMDGVELARTLNELSPEMPVIVLAEEGDRVLDPQALDGEPFQYYCRPVAEAFLRGLRAALDGESLEPAEPVAIYVPPVAEDERGPVPEVDLRALRGVVTGLMRDVGALGALLADRTGRVLIEEGATRNVNPGALAGLLGPAFARVAEIAPLVGGRAWNMQYYDGDRFDVFALGLGLHHFVCLVFDGGNRGMMGAVTMFGRRAADRAIALIGAAAYDTSAPADLPLPQQNGVDHHDYDRRDEQPPVDEAVDSVEIDDLEDTLLEDFDADLLFEQAVDEGLADSLFSLERLGDIAATLETESDDRVDYNQARDLGLLDD